MCEPVSMSLTVGAIGAKLAAAGAAVGLASTGAVATGAGMAGVLSTGAAGVGTLAVGTAIPAATGTFLGLSAGAWSAIATGMSLASVVHGGFKQKEEHDFKAKIARDNAKIEKMKIANETLAGEAEREKIRLEHGQMEAEGVAQFAGSGGTLGIGDDVSWRLSQAGKKAYDLSASRYNTELSIWEHQILKSNYNDTADMYNQASKNAIISTAFDATGLMVGGVADSMMPKSTKYTFGMYGGGINSGYRSARKGY